MTTIKFEGGPIDGEQWTMQIHGDTVVVPLPPEPVPMAMLLDPHPEPTASLRTFNYRLYRYGNDQALALPEYAQELVKVGAAMSVDHSFLAHGNPEIVMQSIASKLQKQMEHHAELRLLEVLPATITIESDKGREQFQDDVVVWAWTRPWTWAK